MIGYLSNSCKPTNMVGVMNKDGGLFNAQNPSASSNTHEYRNLELSSAMKSSARALYILSSSCELSTVSVSR